MRSEDAGPSGSGSETFSHAKLIVAGSDPPPVGGPFEGAIVRRLMVFFGAEGGRVSRERFLAVFDRLDRDGDGYISEAELRAAI